MLKRLLTKKRYFKCIYKEQKGITGLETAIILIAFVVVAAVFAYTVLSAGLFATQKSQEAVYSGLESTQATMELKSSVIAEADPANPGDVGQLIFTLAIATGGEAIDFTPPTDSTGGLATSSVNQNYVTISYIDKYQRIDNLFWTKMPVGQDNGNNLLDPGEQFQITVGGSNSPTDTGTSWSGGNNLVQALDYAHPLSANDTFTIEIKTAKGAVLSFQRTMPGSVSAISDLH